MENAYGLGYDDLKRIIGSKVYSAEEKDVTPQLLDRLVEGLAAAIQKNNDRITEQLNAKFSPHVVKRAAGR